MPTHCIQYKSRDYAWLSYRPPPSNNIFPDVLLHTVVAPFIDNPLQQKVWAGAALIFISALFIGWRQGLAVVVTFFAMYATTEFYFFDTTAHFALPLCLALFLAARPQLVEAAIVVCRCVFRSVVTITPGGLLHRQAPPATRATTRLDHYRRVRLQRALFGVQPFFGETNTGSARFLPGSLHCCPVAAEYISFCLVVSVVFTLATAFEWLPSRYAITTAAALILFLFPFPARSTAADWRLLALPLAVIGIFLSQLNTAPVSSFTGPLRLPDRHHSVPQHWCYCY